METRCRSFAGAAWIAAAAAGCAPAAMQTPAPPATAAEEQERADRERFQAKVRYDPAALQGISGFVRLGRVYSSTTGSAAAVGLAGNPRDLDMVADAVNEYTQIRAEFAPDLPYSDPRLTDLPIIIPQGPPNEVELEQLTRYLLSGGFALDAGLGFDTYREGLEKYGGRVWGQDGWVERLPDDHPLFSAFFRLGQLTSSAGQAPRGLVVDGRLAVLDFAALGPRLEDKRPGPARPEPPPGVSPGATQLTRQLTEELAAARRAPLSDLRFEQMAVNAVVFALTQEGSIAQRASAPGDPE